MDSENKIHVVDITAEVLASDDALRSETRGDLAPLQPVEISSSRTEPNRQRLAARYILLPFLFLTVALLGGLRIAATDSSFIFTKPPLVCLIFAAIMLVLIFRAGLVRFDAWLSEDLPPLKNVANAAILITLFAATTQIFNALIPEQGLPFWIVAFCFFWTLWNNLFADFDTRKLLRSLGALFGLAFVAKYLVLANLTAAPTENSLLWRIFENPTKEAFTWLLDLPRFSAATGYIQFFAAAFYLFGLYLMPPSTRDRDL